MARTPDVHSALAGTWPRMMQHVAVPPSPALDADDVGGLLDQMSREIQTRMADIERRHAGALHDMQTKLESLSGDAARARPAMPPELAIAFGRVEAGMADLVDRIAETVPERRRGADAFVFGDAKADHSHFVFNPPARSPLAPVTLEPPASGDAWGSDAAEALARLYESGEAALAKSVPTAAASAEITQARAPTICATAIDTANQGNDREWLDHRFGKIAEHISATVREGQPDGLLDALMARVDRFEARFATALDGVANKADLNGLQHKAYDGAFAQIEDQIKDLASHIDHTHQQLSRLDAIEQQLADLTAYAHAAMDESRTSVSELQPAAAPDFGQLAELAAERVLARLPAHDRPDHAATETRVTAMQAMLEDFTAERRRGDQTTSEILETVQEALIRLIDRLDVLDQGTKPPQPFAPAVAAPFAPAVAAPLAPAGAAPEVPAGIPGAIDLKSLKTIRRRERRVIGPATATPAELREADQSQADAEKRTEININDLRLNINRPAGDAEPGEPAPVRGARAASSRSPAVSGAGGKRGMAIAAMALSLVGVSYVASLLIEDHHKSQVPGAAANAMPAAEKASAPAIIVPAPTRPTPPDLSTVPSVSVPSVSVTGRAGALPPGMVGAPVRIEPSLSAVQPPAAAEGSVAPPAPTRLPPAPDATGRSSSARPVPGQPDMQFPPTPPQTVPETVNDDLSQADIDERGSPADRTRPAPAASHATAHAVPMLAMPGLALASHAGPAQIGELASAQRQASMAMASESAGARARGAASFSKRYPVAGTPQMAPRVMAASPMTTGSNPPADMQPLARPADPYNTVAGVGAAPSEMPPALVGPLSLRLAAAKGDPSASFEVATRFAEGRGLKQDFKQALTWYQRSAAKGFAVAQYRLGTLYERGLGTAADPASAMMWYKRAAEQGNVKAMHNLAVLSAGNGQAAPDYETAAKWFTAASEHGLTDSQFNLAVLFENGLGVAKDKGQAYVWYALAARNGDAEATKRRDKLVSALDVSVLQMADDRVRDWHAKMTDSKINDARVAGDLWRNQTASAQQR